MAVYRKTVRTRRGLREYSYLGCPLTRNRSAWCFRICEPDAAGNGPCGRIAPHSLKSRIQQGIDDHEKRRLALHMQKLERLYLSAPCNAYYDPGISIAEGAAEIVIQIQEKFHNAAGTVHGSVYFKALDDGAVFAVNSLVPEANLVTAFFNTYLTRPIASGTLIAKGRFTGRSGKQYLAESVLTDADGQEIGRGNGVFMKSKGHP